jgi:hypothetical protein
LTICAFDIMKQPHDSAFTFDVNAGQKYCNFWPVMNTFKGYPLDSKFRLWPDERYFADATNSQMAHTATSLPVDKKAIKDYEARIRCRRARTPTGSVNFLSDFNRSVYMLVIQNATSNDGITGIDKTTKAGKDTIEVMIQPMVSKNQLMAFEQGLKMWRTKWADTLGVGEDPATKPSIPVEAVERIVGVVSLVFQENLAVDEKIKAFRAAGGK